MALSTNLVRRGGIYYFRCRVPNDLVARLGRAELSRSLATANPDVARRRGRRAAHLVEQVWLLVRECMSPEQIDDVIRRWLKAELDKDELARTNTAFAGDYAAQRGIDVKVVARDMFGSDAATKLDEWREHALDARWEEAEPWANTIIRDQELPITKGSDEYRRLCLRLLPALVDFHDIRLERSEGNWSKRIELPNAPPVAPELSPAPKKAGEPLDRAIEEHLASLRHSRSQDQKRIMKVGSSLSLFSQWLGGTPTLEEIDRATVGRFRQALEILPPNWTKRFKGASILEVLALAKERELTAMTHVTANGHLAVISGFFDWCISAGKLGIGQNPAAGVRIADGVETHPDNRRATFTTEELAKLLGSPLYTGCKSASRVTITGKFNVRDWRFWLFPILLFTGARLGEVCQLSPEDILQVNGIWCFNITDGGDKRVKTSAGIRMVPIHQELIKMGILTLKAERRGKTTLLPDVPPADEHFNNASKWGLRYLKAILGTRNGDGEKYVLHGFRHTMETKLREIEGVEEWVQHTIIGHEYKHVSEHYPISSFLFWQVLPENRENWQTYKFIENFRYGQTHNELVNPDGRSLTLVLDGQQRLTSLLIGLRGSYTVKMKNRRADNPNAWVKQWLYLDLLKEPITEDEESDLGVTYGFHFWPDAPTPTVGHFWLKVGKILDFNSEDKFDDFKDQLWDEVADDTPKSKERVFRKNLDRLYRLVWKDEVIAYYTEKDQSYDRVLDIFVRANDGGTKLSKSDLLLSTFTSKWSGVNAREEIYDFVERLNGDLDRKNSFNKDLIMRACLVLSDLDTHYVTDNFTNKNLRIIEQNWPRIKKSIEYTVRLVNRFGFDRDTLTSSNALLPIAYYLFKTGPTLLDGETQFDVTNADRIRRWLIIALLNGVFGGASSNTLRSARTILQEQLLASKDFPIAGLIDGLKEQAGHRAVIEGNDASGFLDTRYTSKTSFTALSLLYDERNWGTTLYHIDHIIPKSMCTPSELRKQDIPEALIPRIAEACDRIGNLQLLPASENITKSNMPFSEWIRTRDQSFLERHMIPSDPNLWHPRALPDFVREREKMIQRRVIKVLNIDQASPEGTGGNPLLAAV